MSTGPIPDYLSLSDVPPGPLDQLPCPEPGFRLVEQPYWSAAFPVRNYVLDVTQHGATGWLSVVWSIDVQRPLSQMLNSLDPRNWNFCSNTVHIAAEVSSVQAPCPPTDTTRPPTEGTSWKNYFWEELGVNGDQTLALSNQLYFTFDVSPRAIVTTLFSDQDPNDPGKNTTLDGQIEFDRGWAAYGPAPWDRTGAWTRLRVVKYLKFTSGSTSDLAVLLLYNWAHEEVVSEVTCILT
jgi:hypothetical protein